MEKPIKPKKPRFTSLPYPQRTSRIYRKFVRSEDTSVPQLLTAAEMVSEPNKYFFIVDRLTAKEFVDAIGKLGLQLDKVNITIFGDIIAGESFTIFGDIIAGESLGIEYDYTMSNAEFNAQTQQYIAIMSDRKQENEKYSDDVANYAKQKALYDFEMAQEKLKNIQNV